MAGYVYLLRSEDGEYKIGQSKNPAKRAKYINYAHRRVTLLWSLKCNDPTTTERAMHVRFREYHITHEWFDLPNSAVEWIKAQTEEGLCEGYNGNYGRPDTWHTIERWH